MKRLEKKLLDIAREQMTEHKSFCDYTPEHGMVYKSRLNWIDDKPYYIEAYYTNEVEHLCVLSHEVGHLKTLPQLGGMTYYRENYFNTYHAEKVASLWAINFLEGNGIKGKLLNDCIDELQKALDSHYAYLNQWLDLKRVELKTLKREAVLA